MKHPCHKNQLNSLKRIEGQIWGIEKMIEEGKYCIEILHQIKAVKNSITSVDEIVQILKRWDFLFGIFINT